jgi:hypothetical protein
VSQDNTLAPTPTPAEILTNLERRKKRATKGDKAARHALRQLLHRPDCFQQFRDVASRVRDALSRKFAGDDWFVKEQPEYRNHWQRQVDHAHRRFLAAVRLLTAVRRLPRPALQVNIGEQQVNVSG